MRDDADLFHHIDAGDSTALNEALSLDPSLAQAHDRNGISAVLHALYRGRDDMVGTIFAALPNLDVFEAAALGEIGQLTSLLEEDAELMGAWSPDGFTPLHLAAFFGRMEAVRLLLERGADVEAVSRNRMSVTPLHSSAASGQAEIAGILLAHGADPNARQHGGWTPLMQAADRGDEAMARLLLAHGADPEPRRSQGRRPWHWPWTRGMGVLLSY